MGKYTADPKMAKWLVFECRTKEVAPRCMFEIHSGSTTFTCPAPPAPAADVRATQVAGPLPTAEDATRWITGMGASADSGSPARAELNDALSGIRRAPRPIPAAPRAVRTQIGAEHG